MGISRLPWMYKLLSRLGEPFHPMYECPLCFAIVASGSIKKHTAYHESKGENDNGD